MLFICNEEDWVRIPACPQCPREGFDFLCLHKHSLLMNIIYYIIFMSKDYRKLYETTHGELPTH